MFNEPIEIALLQGGETLPLGWYLWQGPVPITPRMRAHAHWLTEAPPPLPQGGALNDVPPSQRPEVTIVRAAPGTGDAYGTRGLAAVCGARPWPVSEDEIAAEQRAARETYGDDLSPGVAAAAVQNRDPQAGYALRAPLGLTARDATAAGAQSLYSSEYMGRVRRDGRGWVAEQGWGGALRTLPGGPYPSARAALEGLRTELQPRFVEAMQALQRRMGGDVGWGGIAAPEGPRYRVVTLTDGGDERVEWEGVDRGVRWAREVAVRPLSPGAGGDYWLGTSHVACPDCGGHVVWCEAGYTPGYRRCVGAAVAGLNRLTWQFDGGCGADWTVGYRADQVLLERVEDAAAIGEVRSPARLGEVSAMSVLRASPL